jgi:hypothetical protein
MFQDRTLIIATKHAKERAIAPMLEEALGVRCVVPDSLDTDELGTFTGEVERRLDPLETAREKCRRALAAGEHDLAVASEGSFGPHPVMVFAPGDDELLVLVDQRNELELVVREVSASTNFAAEKVVTESALLEFAKKARFPEHGLILRESRDSPRNIYKGITDEGELLDTFHRLQRELGSAYVETDMRANYNPLRMGVISDAARKLADLAQSTCPACAWPGFRVTDVIPGLPCGLCGLPTNSASRHVSTCERCGHTEELRYPGGKEKEDPQYCEFCNP